MTNARELIVWNRHLSLFNNVYEFSMIIVPSIIVAPRYFSGEVLSCVHIFPIGRVSTIHILQPNKAFNICGYVHIFIRVLSLSCCHISSMTTLACQSGQDGQGESCLTFNLMTSGF